VADKLHPGGLSCVSNFRYTKILKLRPPWGVSSGVYWDMLVRGGTGIIDQPIPEEVQDRECENTKASSPILYVKPRRSHAAGKRNGYVVCLEEK